MNSETNCTYFSLRQWRAVESRNVSDLTAELSVTAFPSFVLFQNEPIQLVKIAPMQLFDDTKVNFSEKDLLMDNPDALLSFYAEFDEEDREIAQEGLTSYTRLLEEEDNSA
jgi:hypothetical protein